MNIYDMNQFTLLFESCGICLTVLLVIILVETLLASKVSYSCVSQGLNLCQCIFRDNLVINQGIKSSSIDSDSMSGFPPLTEPRVTLKRALHPSRREKVVKPGVEAYLIHNVTAFITCHRAWVCSLYFLFAGPRGFRGIKITSFLLYSQFIHTSGLQAPDHWKKFSKKDKASSFSFFLFYSHKTNVDQLVCSCCSLKTLSHEKCVNLHTHCSFYLKHASVT